MSYSSAYNQDSGYPSDTWARPPPPENQASSYNYSMGNQNSGSGEHSSQSWRAERHERSDRSYKTSSRDRDRSPSHHSKRSKSSRSPKRSSRHRSRSRDRYSRHSSRSRSRTRERSRRKRSRSRSRTWSKSRSRSPNTKHSRKRSRSPFMAKKRYSPVGPEPSYKIMLTSIPQHIDRDDLNIILAQQGYHPIDVRVIRKQVGGDTRVFGFIDFADVPTAKAWYEHNQGILRFEDGSHAKLDYSREPEHFRERQQQELNKPLTDWNCAKCTINNFNRRTNCFKCGTPRTESEAMEAKGYGMVGVAPCDTLLIRELPQGVDEGRIHASLAQYSNVPVQRIHIASSKMYALVQMRSIEDASYMLSTFNKVMPYIDNCAVIITFSRQSLNQVVIAECIARGQLPAVDPNSHVGKLQAAALQIAETSRSHQPMESTYIQSPMPSVQTISTPVGVFQIHSAPDPRNFQLEASSGYYYDSTTGFYFDSKTEYYYNSQVGQWMFWCQKYGAYIPVEGGNQELKKQMQEEEKLIKMSSSQIEISAPPQPASATVEPEPQHQEVHQEPQQPPVEDKKEKKKKKEKDPNKPKTAQDIAKEMEKWAKRQEKVKMTFNKPEPKTPGNARYFDTSIAPAPRRDSIGEQAIEKTKATFMDDDDDEDVPNAPPPPEATVRIRGTVNLPLNKDPRRGTVPADQHQQITNDPTTAPTREAKDQPLFDEEQYVNREKIACLLCKRSFPKLETLEKHLKMSDLHKSNLEAKRKEFNLANPQPEQPESSVNYRDRADERRKKFGYDPTGLIEETPSGVPAGPIGPVGSIPVPVIQNPMALQQAAMIKAATPLDESNIGNKLLKSMGWSEGKGLGKNNQGIVNPIQAQQRAPGVGLGSNVSVTNPSVLGGLYGHNRSSYLKAHTIQRWNELPDNQQ